MISYIRHIIELQKKQELVMDYILPDSYDWLEDQKLITRNCWKDYLSQAFSYHLKLLQKNPVTLAESIDRVKIHNRKEHSRSIYDQRVCIAKKMAVYEFANTVIEIKEHQVYTVTSKLTT